MDKDRVRSALFPPDEIEYSTAQDDFCMGILYETAAYMLQKQPERLVLIDGRPFSRSEQIEQVAGWAEKMRQSWRIVECVCSEKTARKRLAEQAGEHLAANRSYPMYQRIRAEWEEIVRAKTLIDTDRAIEVCVRETAAALGLRAE